MTNTKHLFTNNLLNSENLGRTNDEVSPAIFIIFVIRTIYDAMITPEEYEKRVESPITDEEDNIKLPIPAVVTIIVLSSLIGIIIVCEAIFGL